MRPFILAAFAAAIALASPAIAADVSILGTYRLVSEQRTIVDTKEVIPGTGARGYITYGEDGRMIVLIVRQPRPRPEGAEKNNGSAADRTFLRDHCLCGHVQVRWHHHRAQH